EVSAGAFPAVASAAPRTIQSGGQLAGLMIPRLFNVIDHCLTNSCSSGPSTETRTVGLLAEAGGGKPGGGPLRHDPL
ncbi:hypothetical protein P7K49_009028, partial [Saguinus oedipus]